MNKYFKSLALLLTIAFVFGDVNLTYASSGSIKIGQKATGTLGAGESDTYVITADNDMKVKIKASLKLKDSSLSDEEDKDIEIMLMNTTDYQSYLATIAEDEGEDGVDDADDAVYDDYDNEEDDDDEDEDEAIDFLIRDFVDVEEEYVENIELKKGKYVLVFNNDDYDVEYQVAISDISKYTKQIKLNKKKLTLKAKKSAVLVASSKQKGKYIKKVTWKSSNKKIAKVDKSGKVTGVKAGKCTITAWVKGGKKVTCTVTVKGKK